MGIKVCEEVPFSGPLMLPNKDQLLKLHMFYRDYYGKKDPAMKATSISTLLAELLYGKLSNNNNPCQSFKMIVLPNFENSKRLSHPIKLHYYALKLVRFQFYFYL